MSAPPGNERAPAELQLDGREMTNQMGTQNAGGDVTSVAPDADALPFADPHGKLCTPLCDELARLTEISGPRAIRCPYCGANPGRGCRAVCRERPSLMRFGAYHPARLEAA